MNFANNSTKKTSLIIHAFAVAHGSTTLLLGSGADTAFLTAETIGMLYSIFKANNYTTKLPLHLVAGALGSLIASKIATTVAGVVVRFIPLIGEAADRIINVPSTILTTELLGWATYALLSFLDDNQILDTVINKKKLSAEDKKLIMTAAKDYKKKYGGQGKKLYKKMSKADKDSFNKLIKKIQAKDTDDDMRMQISDEIMELISKYLN